MSSPGKSRAISWAKNQLDHAGQVPTGRREYDPA